MAKKKEDFTSIGVRGATKTRFKKVKGDHFTDDEFLNLLLTRAENAAKRTGD